MTEDDPIAEITAMLRADTDIALASIEQTRILAARLGFQLPDFSHGAGITFGSSKRGPSVSATKGKSKPNLAGWLRRATPDGTLPSPNTVLIVSERMVRQGLEGGYIVGTNHPYRVTENGLRYAVATFKGKKISRG